MPRPDELPEAVEHPAGTGAGIGAEPAPPTGGRVPVFVVVAILVVASVAIGIEAPGYRPGAGGEPGPAAVPLLLAGLMLLVAALLVVAELRTERPQGAGGVLPPTPVLLTVGALLAAYVLLPLLGFFLVFTGLLTVLGFLSGARTWWSPLLVGAVSSWVALLLFGRGFAVPLPVGPIDLLLGG
ncbi:MULTISPECIES: tripartite tricarboxylate transporter TctB family protein [Pseudonocardia]|uniref:Tripartite tricarboxylate transporter TctB family protein n=2 Tax=Pseudonocardia TaxID=1847 RepID=A0A1Y2MP42_PSEAH|nr:MULTISPECIES: tripartite tricarboxylate transporter TctB family protein [Pseudonocardia]OSY36238.1 Tripartite tricarboxylate transporter TctB family protein [Pseudonocardia autotrophica]TDN73046.1 tripartite tricarboxylate transporter TctB family protein [Pseudonocardia autotrophica]BBG03764.1 hypothetical protein Pdca_49730 [Pseudonocardia autotrophica]GEC26628.1 hypothetical protein PSA01_36570 [Pseudonocardia saturnea]